MGLARPNPPATSPNIVSGMHTVLPSRSLSVDARRLRLPTFLRGVDPLALDGVVERLLDQRDGLRTRRHWLYEERPPRRKRTMKGLLVKLPWIDKILRGEKTWELRGSNTRIRGPIALIQSGTGTVVGVCELTSVEGPLSLVRLRRTTARHRVPVQHFKDGLPYPKTYAWSLRGARRLPRAVPYRHPSGAVIWVILSPGVAKAIRRLTGGWSGRASHGLAQVRARHTSHSAAKR
jgi:hypothetical protein